MSPPPATSHPTPTHLPCHHPPTSSPTNLAAHKPPSHKPSHLLAHSRVRPCPVRLCAQNKRGGRVQLKSIVIPDIDFNHSEKGEALYAMEMALALEKVIGRCGAGGVNHVVVTGWWWRRPQ